MYAIIGFVTGVIFGVFFLKRDFHLKITKEYTDNTVIKEEEAVEVADLEEELSNPKSEDLLVDMLYKELNSETILEEVSRIMAKEGDIDEL